MEILPVRFDGSSGVQVSQCMEILPGCAVGLSGSHVSQCIDGIVSGESASVLLSKVGVFMILQFIGEGKTTTTFLMYRNIDVVEIRFCWFDVFLSLVAGAQQFDGFVFQCTFGTFLEQR
jgi:hypothetical protein